MAANARLLLRILLGTVLTLFLSEVGVAQEEQATATTAGKSANPDCEKWICANTMDEVKEIINKVITFHPPEKTLIVFDIDNTLLTMNQDLGSDAWFNWQHTLIDKSSSPFRVAENLAGLFVAQRMLFDLSDMHPPEKATPDFVNNLAKQHPTMVLTARRPDMLGATFRELSDVPYGFPNPPKCGSILCSAPQCGSKLCPTPGLIADTAILRTVPRAEGCFKGFPKNLGPDIKPIVYTDGVMMANSQNKGAILQILLASGLDRDCLTTMDANADTDPNAGYKATPHMYDAIIFVDDGGRNAKAVSEAFNVRKSGDWKTIGPDDWVTVVQYTNLDDEVERFKSDPERLIKADCAWRDVQSVLCAQFGQACPTWPRGPSCSTITNACRAP